VKVESLAIAVGDAAHAEAQGHWSGAGVEPKAVDAPQQ
jgi:hypothetical protein